MAPWSKLSISEIADFGSGEMVSVAQLQRRRSPRHSVPVYGGNGVAGFTSAPMIDDPTVILGRVGQKCGVVYRNSGPAWITDNALYARRFKRRVDVRFFALALQAARLNDVKNKNDLPLITQGILDDVKLAWPPSMVEQRAIAGALDAADELIGGLKRVLLKKLAIRQGMIQELLTGMKRLPGFDKPWTARRLGEIGGTVRGVGYKPDEDLSARPSRETVNLLRANNVQDAALDLRDVQYVHRRRVRTDQYLRVGDVLICGANGSKQLVGKAAPVQVESPSRMTFGAFMMVYRPNETQVLPAYAALHFQTKPYRDLVEVLLAGSSINNLRPSDVAGLEIPLPSRDEQTAIAAVINDATAEIDALGTRLVRARDIKTGMMQQLLTGRVRLPVEAA
jgi:type I restriction enzyme S subunit